MSDVTQSAGWQPGAREGVTMKILPHIVLITYLKEHKIICIVCGHFSPLSRFLENGEYVF